MDKTGWRELLTEKRAMLSGFDRSEGKFAEAEFRKWLKQFLPKRYDVTSGYVIFQKYSFTVNPHLLHYD